MEGALMEPLVLRADLRRGPLDQLGSLQLRRRTYVSLFMTITYVSLFLTITYVSFFLTRRYSCTWHLATVYLYL